MHTSHFKPLPMFNKIQVVWQASPLRAAPSVPLKAAQPVVVFIGTQNALCISYFKHSKYMCVYKYIYRHIDVLVQLVCVHLWCFFYDIGRAIASPVQALACSCLCCSKEMDDFFFVPADLPTTKIFLQNLLFVSHVQQKVAKLFNWDFRNYHWDIRTCIAIRRTWGRTLAKHHGHPLQKFNAKSKCCPKLQPDGANICLLATWYCV